MRFHDLVETTVQDDLVNDVEEFVVRAKARNFSKISTPTLLAKLKASGYTLNMESLLDILNKIEIVGSVNRNEITLDIAIPTNKVQKDDDTVSKMAANQIKKGMR
jgi:hypothetical protein